MILRVLGDIELALAVVDPVVEAVGGDAGGGRKIGRRLLAVLHPHLHRDADLLVAVALAHLRAIEVLDDRQMHVDRPLVAQRLLQRDVEHGVEQVLLAAQDVRDAHLGIINHHREVIGGHAVALADDEVLHLAGRHALAGPEHGIVEAVLLHRHGEAHDVRPVLGLILPDLRIGELRPAIDERPLLLLGLLAHGIELLARLVGLVGLAVGDQLLDERVVDRGALRLVDQLGVVPLQPKPAQVLQQLVAGLLGRAGQIGILDAQQKPPAEVAGQQPVEQRRAGAADVQIAGGRRAKRVTTVWFMVQDYRQETRVSSRPSGSAQALPCRR